MSKRKIIIIIAIIALLIVGGIISFFVLKQDDEEEFVYKFSEEENINVDIDSEKIPYFESFSFLGKNITEIQTNIKNTIDYSSNELLMKNIILFDTSGDFTLYLKDEKIYSANFVSSPLFTPRDTKALITALNGKIANKISVEEKPVVIVKKDGTQTTEIVNDLLYSADNKLEVCYITSGKKINIYSILKDDKFYVNIDISSS